MDSIQVSVTGKHVIPNPPSGKPGTQRTQCTHHTQPPRSHHAATTLHIYQRSHATMNARHATHAQRFYRNTRNKATRTQPHIYDAAHAQHATLAQRVTYTRSAYINYFYSGTESFSRYKVVNSLLGILAGTVSSSSLSLNSARERGGEAGEDGRGREGVEVVKRERRKLN